VGTSCPDVIAVWITPTRSTVQPRRPVFRYGSRTLLTLPPWRRLAEDLLSGEASYDVGETYLAAVLWHSTSAINRHWSLKNITLPPFPLQMPPRCREATLRDTWIKPSSDHSNILNVPRAPFYSPFPWDTWRCYSSIDAPLSPFVTRRRGDKALMPRGIKRGGAFLFPKKKLTSSISLALYLALSLRLKPCLSLTSSIPHCQRKEREGEEWQSIVTKNC